MKKFNICVTTTYNYHFTTSIYANNWFAAYRIANKWTNSKGFELVHRIYVDEIEMFSNN